VYYLFWPWRFPSLLTHQHTLLSNTYGGIPPPLSFSNKKAFSLPHLSHVHLFALSLSKSTCIWSFFLIICLSSSLSPPSLPLGSLIPSKNSNKWLLLNQSVPRFTFERFLLLGLFWGTIIDPKTPSLIDPKPNFGACLDTALWERERKKAHFDRIQFLTLLLI
jgi:hypothetical protein